MNNCTIILFGATGDLARRKLFPALYSLVAANKLETFAIVGAAIEDKTIGDILEGSREFIKHIDEQVWKKLSNNTYYFRLDFNLEKDFQDLNAFVSEVEKKHGLSGNRLAYLAAPPDFFCAITTYCASSGLIKRIQNPWQRIVYEKPFGKSLASARAINACIAKSFDENQLFRIDHYLTKEVVGNIVLVRFTNCIFEPLWSNQYIDHVTIILDEKVCIEGRGIYYDAYGVLRDVVQNHMFELLTLIAMESPAMLTGDYIRDERMKVLKHLAFVDGILGQYENYKTEKGVAPDSQTDTFANLLFHVNNKRWAGVPFFIRTGKCLNKKLTEIQITFKKVDCLLLQGCPIASNNLTINIWPKGTFSLSLNAKKPGMLNELTQIEMEFCHSCQFGPVTPESYEVIFQEVMRGEQSISVRFDEIEQAWNIIDTLIKKKMPIYQYKRGSEGPKESRAFEKKYGLNSKDG